MINLYSDTQTLPTPEMLTAIASAELGDDVMQADPTVNRLEKMAAGRLEKEAALLVSSGTMANLCALMVHCRTGDEVYLDAEAHVYNYEGGGLSSIAGATPRFVIADRGQLDPEDLKRQIRGDDVHFARARLLWLENTHCGSGGAVLKPDLQAELSAIARQHGLSVHLDGARIFNAAAALRVPVATLAREVDSVSFCLSKGLSCPIGSLLVGSADFIAEARRVRKRLGGGMRQAGIIAACGLVALEATVQRLADDHENAAALASELYQVDGLEVDPRSVETNMVFADVSDWKVDCFAAQKALAAEGVLVSEMEGSLIRLVTHRGFSRKDVAEVREVFDRVAKGFLGA